MKTIKKYILLLIIPIVMVCCCGNQLVMGKTQNESVTTGEASLKHNGEVTVVFNIKSDEPREQFVNRLDRTIKGYNDNSGDDNFIKVIDVAKADNGYSVEIKTRRIDKVKAMGDFDWKPLSTYVSYADNCKLLQNYEKGNWRNTWSVYYEGMAGRVQLDKNGVGQTSIQLFNTKGELQKMGEFINSAKTAQDSDKLFMFRMVDVGAITSIKISFPGEIKYYAGNNVVLVDDDTLEIKATEVQASSLVRYKAEINESGEEVIEDEILSGEPINAMLGYVVYEQSISPGAIAGSIIGVVVTLGGLLLLIRFLILKGRRESVGDISKEKPSVVRELAIGISSVFHGKTWKNIVKSRWMYLIILPAFVLVGIFCYLPMFGVLIAFKDYNLLEGFGGSEWIGLKAFEQVFVDPTTANYMSVRNTIYISILRIASNFPIILIFSLLINEIRSKRSRSTVQAISYIPYFISWIAVGGLANNLFTQDGGILNSLLNAFGQEGIAWYNEPRYWWVILAVSSLWKGMGWSTLIYISAMGTIDDELYDACRIDGGGRFRQMLTVTLPGISHVITLQLLLDVGSLVRDNADQIMAMTNGSPALDRTTMVIGTSLINTITGVGGGSYATATALGITQGIVGLILVLITNRVVKKTEHEGLI